ncbi:GDSL-type esterase/lipase family protein [Niabella aquatica]
MKKIKWLVVVAFLFFAGTVKAQAPFPFWNDIQKFKQQDSAVFPASNQILFIGSSSFTLWKDVQDYFPGYKILNRAFGGSTLLDLIRYRYDVIFPYAPKQIVMYCGENDFASADQPSVETVLGRFRTLYKYIRDKYPSTLFVYVSMKPSPSRKQLQFKYREANESIKQFLLKDKKAKFVDVYSLMLNEDGSIMSDIFLGDNLHMNAKGYTIWKKAMRPYLRSK